MGQQRLRHGDLCLCGLKARLIQGIPQTTCRLELPGRRSLTAQGPSPGEAGQPCAQQLHLQLPFKVFLIIGVQSLKQEKAGLCGKFEAQKHQDSKPR
ncbi:hypothetical protein EK904_006080 [Melospiza melodia maxima]|nr:hypothetical protein EK904_006080 [Melospiza melodia maxima]